MVWGVIFFGGPSLFKWFVVEYSDGRIEPKNVKVTPTLGVQVAILNFELLDDEASISLSGFSRSMSINWSFFDPNSFVTIRLGPTVLQDSAQIDSITFSTPSLLSLWDNAFESLPFKLEAENVLVNTIGQLEAISLEAFFSFDDRKVNNLVFTGSKAKAKDRLLFEADSIKGKVSPLHFARSIIEQSVDWEVSFDGIMSKIRCSSSEMIVDFKSSMGVVDFALGTSEIQLPNLSGKVENVTIDGSFQIAGLNSDLAFLDGSQIEFDSGSILKNKINFGQFLARIVKSDNNIFSTSVEVNLDKSEIHFQKSILGSFRGASKH